MTIEDQPYNGIKLPASPPLPSATGEGRATGRPWKCNCPKCECGADAVPAHCARCHTFHTSVNCPSFMELDTPYSVHAEYPTMLCDRHGGIVAQGVPPAEAALIVEAVNEREGLKAQLARVKGALTNCANRLDFLIQHCKEGSVTDSQLSIAISDLQFARAALRPAGGKDK